MVMRGEAGALGARGSFTTWMMISWPSFRILRSLAADDRGPANHRGLPPSLVVARQLVELVEVTTSAT
jgi:hypothetical protein